MNKVIQILFLVYFIFYNAQSTTEENFVKENFSKKEVNIQMCDGTKLFTSIYIPKDISQTKTYPILMQRTCYSVAPSGENEYRKSLGPNPYLLRTNISLCIKMCVDGSCVKGNLPI